MDVYSSSYIRKKLKTIAKVGTTGSDYTSVKGSGSMFHLRLN